MGYLKPSFQKSSWVNGIALTFGPQSGEALHAMNFRVRYCQNVRHRLSSRPIWLLVVLAIAFGSAVADLFDVSFVAQLREAFAHPPDDAKIMMRWWWFGSAVKTAELERELQVMRSAGIGGVEIQPVYPLELDDPQLGVENLPYLSPGFLDDVRFVSETARRLNLRVDVTLGSGWPYGGPHTSVNEAAGKLRVEKVDVLEGTQSVPVPAISNGEELIGAFVSGRQIPVKNDRVEIPAGLSGNDVLLFFISSRTGQQVKRAAVGAEGFVLDHYSKAAIEDHLSKVADPLLAKFGATPPHSVFSDSLEVYSSDWTPDFLERFRKRRGYDLTPHLPALVSDMGRETLAVRHDWAKTLTELAEENYLTPIREWAHARHTLFRSQTYGIPPVILSSNALVDLPEGEHGPTWRRFSAARWASSASHLYGKPVTSTETWTWLHSPAFRATPLDLKAEADRHFVEGINQLVGHGWPYSPPSIPEPGWGFYAAAALNDHNPWFQVMPDISDYLQRVSFLLRQGKAANDIAIYVPTDDAWARLTPGKVAVDEMVDSLLGPALVPQILNAGYNFDFIDDRAIAALGVPYRLLILPNVERIPLATLQKLRDFAQRGGILVATNGLPSLGTGLLEEKSETQAIESLVHQMFEPNNGKARLVERTEDLAGALRSALPPDVDTGAVASAIGFIHRKLPDGDIYFLANNSNRALHFDASFRVSGISAELWDPFNGAAAGVRIEAAGARTLIPMQLAPYESRVVVFSKDAKRELQTPAHAGGQMPLPIDLTSNWKLSIPSLGRNFDLPRLRSWTEDEALRFYSGIGVYQKAVDVPASFLTGPGSSVVLDFGAGTPVEPSAGEVTGMRALLESPVHESAIVFVNNQRAGTVWHPPYELNVTRYLHAGGNALRISVGNLAINVMASRPLPDYRLLNMRYGERFVPQGVHDLRPLPAGITGHVELVKRQ